MHKGHSYRTSVEIMASVQFTRPRKKSRTLSGPLSLLSDYISVIYTSLLYCLLYVYLPEIHFESCQLARNAY